jgi:hypothetical protein
MAEGVTHLLDAELRVFRERLPAWLAHDVGRYALIKDEEVCSPYDAQTDVIQIGYESWGNAPFLVKLIQPVELPARFTRSIE